MTALFVVCAAVGGTVLVLQFLLTLLGLGGHSLGADMPHDVGHDFGGLDHDIGADFHGDSADGGHGVDSGDAHTGDAQHSTDHHGSSWLFGVISFRTVVAALAFFGLAGLAAQSADASTTTTLGVAVAAGLAAMYGVYAMMRALYSLRAEGTARVQHAVGKQGTVYLRIPPHHSGAGKVQINLQNRTMEYTAMTAGDAIPTGATVEVLDVMGDDAVLVQPVQQPFA